MPGVGTLQLVDEDLVTVRFDLNLDTGVGNPGGLKTVAREFRPRIPPLEAVRFEPRGFPGGRTTFVRDPLTVMAWSQAILGTTNNTFDELSVGAGELTRLLRAGGVLKWLPTGSAEARYYDFEPSDGAPLLGDEPEDLFRALTSFAYPAGIPISVLRQPYRRLAELDPSVNVLANPTLLIDRNGDGRPDGWTWDFAPTLETIDAAIESYGFTYSSTAENAFYQVPFLPAASGEAWTASVEGEVASGPGQWFIEVRFLDAGEGHIGGAVSPAQTTSPMKRVSVTATAPASTAKVLWRYFVKNVTASAAVYHIRRAQFEKASAVSRFRCSAQAFSNDPTVSALGRILPVWIEGDAPCPVKLGLQMGTNLLTKNQSDIEIDTGLWVGNLATISRTTAEFQQGVASVQVVTNNSGPLEGLLTAVPSGEVPVVPGRRYTFSIYLKRTAGGTVRLGIEWVGGSPWLAGAPVTLTGAWARHSLTGTAPAGTTSVRLTVYTDVQQALTFFADAVQLQPGPVATPWEAGGSANTQAVRYARLSREAPAGSFLADLLNRAHFRAASATLDETVSVVSDATAVGGTAAEIRRSHHRVQQNPANGNSTSPSVSWGATTVAGRTLLLVAVVDKGVSTGITLTNPAGWTQVVEFDPLSDDHLWVRVLKFVNAGARSGAETFTLSVAKPWACFSIELRDAADVDTFAASAAAEAGPFGDTASTPETVQAYEYLLAIMGSEAAAVQSNPTHGFAPIITSNTNVGFGAYERIATEKGVYTLRTVFSVASPFAGAIIAVKATQPAAAAQRRFRQEVTTKLDSLRGRRRVILRTKPLAPGTWVFQLRWGPSLSGSTVSESEVIRDWTNIGEATRWVEIDLGTITLPPDTPLAGIALEVWAQSVATALEALRFDSLYLAPADEAAAVIISTEADDEAWLGSELLTPVANPSGGAAGSLIGTGLTISFSANCGTPNKGDTWPPGVNKFTFVLRNPQTKGEMSTRIIVRNVTDSLDTASTFVTIPRKRGGVDGRVVVSLYPTFVAGKTYQAQVDDPVSYSPNIRDVIIEKITRRSFPLAVAGESLLTEPLASLVATLDSAGKLSRLGGVQGPVPDYLPPGLNLLQVALLDPQAVGFADQESVLTRTGTLEVTHAPRFYE